MNFQKIFELNLLKFIIAITALLVSAFFSNELFIVCKVGATCVPPIYSYVSGAIFLLDIVYIIIVAIYKIKKYKS